ncbi:MAG: FAD-dependent oxidoreductase, partial [Gemmatimonadota bacterium]|nr:FAD-dependent oxidoreductase [Gemmatimonadota bacterium]
MVIVGGGFAGLYAAKSLRGAPVSVTLIDRTNYHLFQPMLYQVATAALDTSDIASPIRSILRRQRNTEVLMAEVSAVDVPNHRLQLADGHELGYDYLLLAPGVRHSYFGHEDWERFAPGIKTADDAEEVRRRVLLAFEAAEREPEIEKRRALLTFVVVGGGPTGVEVAGALAEIRQYALRRDFRRIDPRAATVMLLEGGRQLLPSYPAALGAHAREALRRLGVEVRTETFVTDVQP